MTKHTPGPWRIARFRPYRNRPCDDVRIVTDTSHVATVLFTETRCVAGTVEPERREANASLIASAPDLLAALEMAVATIERIAPQHGPFSSVDGTLSVARAAIARAEGRG